MCPRGYKKKIMSETWPQVYKAVFILTQLSLKFNLLINVKMLTVNKLLAF